jgi:uncharacterized Zn finger protein (UPF0148 family)
MFVTCKHCGSEWFEVKDSKTYCQDCGKEKVG